ncbi:MAG: flagellar protein FlgN [Desulfobacteraceae bacterium]|jgi:flagellar biosynthesis/type III secretory pathway chaperone|nr:flagellar protein FlgN [Desulfobacteraceae bacterium]
MNVKIIELLDILDEEAACYLEMQRVLDDEERSISLSGRERFDRVQHDKERLVAELQRHEEKRRMLVGRLSEAYRTDGIAMTISQLAQVIKPPSRQHLLDRANRLRSIIGDVHEKNRRNQLMINHHLDLINGSLKLLTHLIEDSSVYQKPGTHQPSVGYPTGGGRFICGSV